jgi:hypothetical protein
MTSLSTYRSSEITDEVVINHEPTNHRKTLMIFKFHAVRISGRERWRLQTKRTERMFMMLATDLIGAPGFHLLCACDDKSSVLATSVVCIVHPRPDVPDAFASDAFAVDR